MRHANSAPNSTDGYAEGHEEAPVPLLLAEDDPQIRRLLAEVFTLSGYAVSCAEDGRDALEQAQRGNFPIVVCALRMTHLSGKELIEALYDQDPYAECILLAECDDLEEVIEAAEAGNVFDHVWKPIQDMGALMRTIARARERRELRLSRARLLTELRDSRVEMRALCSRLEQLDKVAALGQMTGTVAHDLENPLMSLLAYARYLRARLERDADEPLTPEQIDRVLEYLREMEQGVQKCFQVVEDVLDYTRVHEEPPGPVNLHEVIGEALQLLNHGLNAQGIQVNLNLMAAAPPVLANPRRLQQALTNLLLNAAQAFGANGGAILVQTERQEEKPDEDACLTLRITDTGQGIASNVLPRIFEPFFTTHPRTQNLGLGLTIARNMLREWHGDIQVISKPGKGTTVQCHLPICAEIAVSPSGTGGGFADQRAA